MKNLTVIATAFLLGLVAENALAQSWAKAQQTEPNFYAIRQQFLDYWKDQKRGPGMGHSVFRRWEWYWETRVLPDGSFPPSNITTLEWEKYRAQLPAQDLGSAANWTSMGPSSSNSGYNGIGRVNCVAVHPTTNNIIWVGTPAGGLWKSTNGGASWTTNTDNFTNLGVTGILIDPADPNIMYLGTGDGFSSDTRSTGVLKSTDGGQTWNTTGLSWNLTSAVYIRYMAIHPASTGTLLVAASNGLHRSTDGGANWTRVLLDDFYDVKFKPGDPSIVYAAADNRLYKSTNAGATWTTAQIVASSDRIAIAVTPANPELVAAVVSSSLTTDFGAFKGLYLSTNSGSNYTLQSSSPNLLGGAADGNSVKGQGWYDLCIAMSPSDPNLIIVGGVNLWKSTDAGQTWSLLTHWRGSDAPPGTPIVHADKHALLWSGSTLFQGCDGGLYRTSNNGASWADLSANLTISQMYRLGVSQADDKVLCGLQDNGTKLKSNSGTWTDNIGGDGMECFIHPSNPNIMYGELQYGDIRRSTNGGSSWTNIHKNVPDEPDGAWVTPFVMDPNTPTTIYVGYKDVFKSTNQGNSWTAISSGLSSNNLRFIAVAPTSSDIIYASDGYEVFKTLDGGNSWKTVTGNLPKTYLITYLTVDPGNPDNVFVTYGGYTPGQKVYMSTAGGTTWANLSGALPNIPANCITVQPNSNGVLYLGMDVGIYRRDFGATEWTLFNTGLPNVPVTELEIRNSTGKIRASTYGRGLWESDLEPLNNTCLPPAGLAVVSTGSRTATLSWQKKIDATGYGLEIREAGTSTWTPFANLPDMAAQFFYLAPCSNYEFRVQSTCANNSSTFSAKGVFATDGCDTYCLSYGQGKTPVPEPQPSEWIEHVTLNTLDHPSGPDLGYGNFTSLSTVLVQGQTYYFTLAPGFAATARPENWTAWIDFNQDNDFNDPDEQVFAQSNGDGIVTGSITLPLITNTGNTRLRISMKPDSAAGPCAAAFAEGEVEDYTVNILDAPPSLLFAPGSLQFPAAGETQTVILTTNCDWSLSSAPAWIIADPAAGAAGTISISITAGANGSLDSLAGELTFSGCSGQVVQNLFVGQNAGAPSLNVTPPNLEFPASGNSQTITLTTNCDWTLANAPAWISADPQSGSAGLTVVNITAGTNSGTASINGLVTFSGCNGQVSQTLNVVQDGAPLLFNLSAYDITVEYPANCVQLILTANVPWTATSDAPWLTSITPDNGTGSDTLEICYAENPDTIQRQAILVFQPTGGDSVIALIAQLPQPVGVNQAAAAGNTVWCVPNPVRQTAQFFIRSDQSQTVQFDLFSVDGRLVHSFGKITVQAGEQVVPWQTADLPAGCYTFRCLMGQAVISGRIIVLR